MSNFFGEMYEERWCDIDIVYKGGDEDEARKWGEKISKGTILCVLFVCRVHLVTVIIIVIVAIIIIIIIMITIIICICN